jgi:hypothetical protein
VTDHRKACLQAIVDNYGGEDIEYMRRCIYKYTECGAWVSVVTAEGTFHSGSKVPEGADVLGLIVGSIVEGCDEGTDTHEGMFDEYLSADAAAEVFESAVKATESEANSIWHSTHGCPTCALHWLEDAGLYDPEGEPWKGGDDERWQVGDTPTWAECPDCGGHGTII